MAEIKEHLIVFIDILGYKELIKKENIGEEALLNIMIRALQDISKNVEEKKEFFHKLKFNSFSDNFLISIEYDRNVYKNGLLLFLLIDIVMLFQKNMIKNHNIFLRGGMTIGNLYRDDMLVYGTGLIKAYELESKHAIYPRVLLDNEIVNCFESYISDVIKERKNTVDNMIRSIKEKEYSELVILKEDVLESILNHCTHIYNSKLFFLDDSFIKRILVFLNQTPNGRENLYNYLKEKIIIIEEIFYNNVIIENEILKETLDGRIIKICDDNYFINYMYHNDDFIMKGILRYNEKDEENRGNYVSFLNHHKCLIEANLKCISDSKIHLKYEWLKDYHNFYCNKIDKNNLKIIPEAGLIK